jgi:hypothetical protein
MAAKFQDIEKQRQQRRLERKMAKHLNTDYTDAPGVIAFGIVNPKPILNGNEMLVEGVDGLCISKEEALTPHLGIAHYDPKLAENQLWLPLPEDIETLAAEARELFQFRHDGAINPGGRVSGQKRSYGTTEVHNVRVYSFSRESGGYTE